MCHRRQTNIRTATFSKVLSVAESYVRDSKALLLRASLLQHDLIQRGTGGGGGGGGAGGGGGGGGGPGGGGGGSGGPSGRRGERHGPRHERAARFGGFGGHGLGRDMGPSRSGELND